MTTNMTTNMTTTIPSDADVKKALIERIYRNYYNCILTYGSDDDIKAEFGDNILSIHKKTVDLKKDYFEKRRQERFKRSQERRTMEKYIKNQEDCTSTCAPPNALSIEEFNGMSLEEEEEYTSGEE